MKLFFIFLMSISSLFGLEVIVSNPCSPQALIQTEIKIAKPISVGALTIDIFNLEKLQYEGSEAGIVSVNQSPKSLEALEILSENSLRSHGWCYTVNGELSNLLSDEHMLDSQDQKLYWYYGYFFMSEGKWGGDCHPAEMSFLESFCSWSK